MSGGHGDEKEQHPYRHPAQAAAKRSCVGSERETSRRGVLSTSRGDSRATIVRKTRVLAVSVQLRSSAGRAGQPPVIGGKTVRRVAESREHRRPRGRGRLRPSSWAQHQRCILAAIAGAARGCARPPRIRNSQGYYSSATSPFTQDRTRDAADGTRRTHTSSRGHTRERKHVIIGQSLSRHAGHAERYAWSMLLAASPPVSGHG